MAVELKKQLDKEEEMRRTKDESIKALQGDFPTQSVSFKSFIHKLRTYMQQWAISNCARTKEQSQGVGDNFSSFFVCIKEIAN